MVDLAEPIDQLHLGLTVSLIATPKNQFVTCSLEDSLRAVAERNHEKFDHMPVVAAGHRVIGVVNLSRFYDKPAPDDPVSMHYEPLGEQHLVGANTSILSFVRTADAQPFRLVVAEDGLLGLISLSDIQALPVRACLFSLVTGLEISMSDLINRRFKSSSDWKTLLPSGRREKLDDQINRSRSASGIVSELLFTQFADKITIIDKAVLRGVPERRRVLDALRATMRLRDHLAHANDYAPDTRSALEVCRTIRDLLEARQLLRSFSVD